MSNEWTGARGHGRVAHPISPAPDRPSLVPQDVWASYQQELAREERESDESLLPEHEFEEVVSSGESFTASVTADLEVALLALTQVELFAKLSRKSLERLAQSARQGEVPAGEYLFLEGQPAASFYVVLDGALEILRRREGREVALRHLQRGEAIGLLGLLSGQARAASARSIGDALVLEIPGPALNQILAEDAAFRDRLIRFYQERLLESFLGSSKLFSDLDSIGRARMIGKFAARRMKANESLVQPGEVSNLFAVLVTGQLMLELKPKGGKDPKQFHLEPMQFVSVTSAFSGSPCRMRVYASEESTVVLLGQRELSELLKDYPALRALPGRLAQHARAVDRDVFCGHTGMPGV
jgi:cAMP-dependent protein kinase regulator